MDKVCFCAALALALALPSQGSFSPPDFNGRPRGVAKSKMQFYDSSKPFTCLDGSRSMPFDQVNDDFCDCPDGSDEPGTPACSSLGGKFHCANKGHKPAYIPASRVNDGICDCCDGSDEYDGRIQCADSCKELGAKAREETKRLLEVQERGYQLRTEYSQQGAAKQEERRTELATLEAQLKDAETEAERLQKLKEEAEAPETEAKDVHKAAWDAQKTEEQREQAEATFRDLDADSDAALTIAEIQARPEFDKDQSGDVSEEEAKEWLGGEPTRDMDYFASDLWKTVSDVYQKPGSYEPTAPPPPPPEGGEAPPVEPPAEVPAPEGDSNKADVEEGMPEYDEATQELIKVADAARSSYEEADRKKDEVKRNIDDLNRKLDVDLGPNNEFQPLQGNCYDFTDREYTYSLCAFDRVSQKPKHGGSETSLGTWGKWDGTDNKYSVMKFENGLNCWNGPNRSGTVKLRCGETNELVSAAEPNRCEYLFEFITPAVCEPPSAAGQAVDSHDEL
ncbi:glucosidase 2 subunit beta-like isoform X2 [Sycon ciliatum]|uniref:glucosidase 2 subunit beta-like isoform X2 n=1 Tax=Sycon ciliatum TaxID=27933 RepID=UPI0031F60843